MANTHEPDNSNSCWCWSARRDRWGYGRINVYLPPLARTLTLMAHIVAYAWMHRSEDEHWYLTYLDITHSGLELDHICCEPSCIRPCHFRLVTPSQNCLYRGAAR